MTVLLQSFPDIESALMFALVPMEPSIRFVTSMPAGDLPKITARIRRASGSSGTGGAHIYIDRPIVDIDVWWKSSDAMSASIAARNIEADLLSLSGARVTNGVFQRITVVSGPKSVPEANPNLVRYNASYEIRIHS